MSIEQLEPRECFAWFGKIASIPRCSHNEEGISSFLERFAGERGLAVSRDALGNVCIKKPGTPGMDTAPPVILQGHMDMVCVKEDGRDVDFARDPVRIVINGDTVTADGTTLGADNGIALAYMLALLDAEDIPHPPLEAVVTVQEEVGMAGAAGFDVSSLAGKYFINLDSEEEGVFCISCAGGRRTRTALLLEKIPFSSVRDSGGFTFYRLRAGGLAGGHSGMEIAKQRGNAIVLLARALRSLGERFDLYCASFSGGAAANVIPSECEAVVAVKGEEAALQEVVNRICETFRHELRASDGEGLRLSLAGTDPAADVWSADTLRKFLALVTLTPNGVAAMDLNMAGQGLVATSCNLGVAETTEKEAVLSALIRSSVGSGKEFLWDNMRSLATLAGAEISYGGDYPAWEYDPESKLRGVFLEAFETLFARNARAEGIHAGLECGLFFEKFREQGRHMDFIAFGPDITGAHTTREAVSRKSVENMWRLLKEALKLLGEKG